MERLSPAVATALSGCCGLGPRSRGSYAYYVAPPILGSAVDTADDAIRRVPAPAIDELATEWVGWLLRIGPDDLSPERVRRLLGRVEIHPSTVQIVLRLRELPGALLARQTLAELRSELEPGQHIRPDPSHSGLLRLTLPIRLVTRGGRRWVRGPRGGAAVTPAPDKRLVRRLRRGHAILKACAIVPGSISPQVKARAPKSAHDHGLAEFALMAPAIQKSILTGELQMIDLADMPLSWAAQVQRLKPPPAA